jgi:hypothetical protein
LRLAAGNRRPKDRREEGLLFRLGPAAQAVMEVRQAEPVGFFVTAVEGLTEVVEAGAQGRLSG